MTSNRPLSFLIVLAFVFFTAGTATAQSPAQDRTAQLLDAFKVVQSALDGGALTEAQKAANTEAYKVLDSFFDLEFFVAESIAPSVEAFSPEQLTHYQGTFVDLVRMVAYPDSGEFLREAEYTVGAPSKADNHVDVTVPVVLPAEDMEMDITFRWVQVDGALVVRDVLFDDDSLVLEYQNQFKKLIKKEGVAGLLERLDKKQHDEAQKRQGT